MSVEREFTDWRRDLMARRIAEIRAADDPDDRRIPNPERVGPGLPGVRDGGVDVET